jgi:hypothetical protein
VQTITLEGKLILAKHGECSLAISSVVESSETGL